MDIVDSFSLDGRVAIVTGASTGLGKTFAAALAEAGADVVICARREAMLAETVDAIGSCGRQAVTLRADVTVPEQCDAVAEAALAHFGRLDILVNNAGVATAVPALKESTEQFRTVLDTNLIGAFSMAQAAARRMATGGSIVNISSVLAVRSAGLPQAAYSSSKAGLLGLTRDLAQQWSGRREIRVNAILAGLFETEMTEQYPPGYLDRQTDRIILGRPGHPRELAAAVVFLASRASSYVTGATLTVDGGYTVV